MLELLNVRLPLVSHAALHDALVGAAAVTIKIDRSAVKQVELVHLSIDARKKRDIHFVARLLVEVEGDEAGVIAHAGDVNVRLYRPKPAHEVPHLLAPPLMRPIVVGAGPAGLFCALELASAGAAPLVIERGSVMDKRIAAVDAFMAGGNLDPECNIQYGEGGAGTFSDGKLSTNIKNPLCKTVLDTFVAAGAPAEIAWEAKPHIGTDELRDVVRRLRAMICDRGGEFFFDTRVTGVRAKGGGITGVELFDGSVIETDTVVMAIGHSSRETYESLLTSGVAMERKRFSMGVRVEHPQALIDSIQFGDEAENPLLGAADYKLACHPTKERGCYSFCMCPGGSVVAAASEEGGVVVNGMSSHARDGKNANAALLVDVTPADMFGDGVLAGFDFQREWERRAFDRGGGDFRAPTQLLGDFLAGRASTGPGSVEPSYARGVSWTSLDDCLPDFVSDTLRSAFPFFEKKMRGYTFADAVLTGVETRSSCPVSIPRGDSLESNIAGLFPCGEGGGHAGGIMSAAVDGIRVADAILTSVRA